MRTLCHPLVHVAHIFLAVAIYGGNLLADAAAAVGQAEGAAEPSAAHAVDAAGPVAAAVTKVTAAVSLSEARQYKQLNASGWCTSHGKAARPFFVDTANAPYSPQTCQAKCDSTPQCKNIVWKKDGAKCLGFKVDCSSVDTNANVETYSVVELEANSTDNQGAQSEKEKLKIAAAMGKVCFSAGKCAKGEDPVGMVCANDGKENEMKCKDDVTEGEFICTDCVAGQVPSSGEERAPDILDDIADDAENIKNACQSSEDRALWHNGGNSSGEATFDKDMRSCGMECWGKPECVASCVEKRHPYSKTCVRCFGELAICTLIHCWMSCASGESVKCQACNADYCSARFMACSGIPSSEIHGDPMAGLAQHKDDPVASMMKLTRRLAGGTEDGAMDTKVANATNEVFDVLI